MPSGNVSRLRPKPTTSPQCVSNSDTEEEDFNSSLSSASSRSVNPRPESATCPQDQSNSDTEEEDCNSSLFSASSRSFVELPRGRTEARQPDSDRPARTPLHIKIPLLQQAELTKNTVAQNEGDNIDREESKTEPLEVDEDWKMGSPSPIELTYAPAHFHQLYEDQEYNDIVMASPTDPPYSTTAKEVEDSVSWGNFSWETDLNQDAWGTDSYRCPTPPLEHDSSAWESFSW